MKYVILALGVFICTLGSFAQGKKIYLGKNPDNGVLLNRGSNIQPGDTLVLKEASNPYSYIFMDSLIGTAQKPIVIINEGLVELRAGFDFSNCQYMKLTGSGSKDKYGFRILHSGGVAVSVHKKSAHIEAERFYAEDCAFGVWIKNEADCDTSVNNWILNYISIHDYQLKNIKIEGFYMGTTDPNNTGRPIYCNGEQKFYRPSKLGNIKVYNGIIDGTGRPAIMLCNAQYGMSEIYNNVVTNVGREFNDQQGTGISLGMYTRAYVHHNTVKNTYTWGIASLGGSGLIRIENNKVDSSGYLDGRSLPWPQNIMLDTRGTDPVDSTRFIVINNQVDHPGSGVKNIEIWKAVNSYFSTGNIICNNTAGGRPATLRVDAAVKWNNCKTPQQGTAENKNGLWLIGLGGLGIGVLILFFVFRKNKNRNKERPVMRTSNVMM